MARGGTPGTPWTLAYALLSGWSVNLTAYQHFHHLPAGSFSSPLFRYFVFNVVTVELHTSGNDMKVPSQFTQWEHLQGYDV